MKKFLLFLIFLFSTTLPMQRGMFKKQFIKLQSRSFFTAVQRQQTKEFFKTMLKNPIALANIGATGVSTYGISKGFFNGSELFALSSGIQALLSFANTCKMVKADERKSIHKKNMSNSMTVKNCIQSNPDTPHLYKKFLVEHLYNLKQQKASFSICNESFGLLKIVNGVSGGVCLAASCLIPEYNLECMAGSLGNLINAMKLNSEHQESSEIQQQTERYLIEAERAEEIIRKKLESEIKS